MSPSASRRSVFITGCSIGGIGDALARSYHHQGLRVFATGRSISKVQHLKDLGIEVLVLDVTDSVSISQAAENIRGLTDGTLDILINNSGVGYGMPVLDTNLEEVRRMFETNVFGLVATTQAFAPLLLKSKGMVVNIGSVAGVAPFPWQGLYSASKASIDILSNTMRIELAPLGVRVILVVTGGVETNFHSSQTSICLPKNSVYIPAKDVVERTLSGKNNDGRRHNVNNYAAVVVQKTLKRNPSSRIWAGGRSTIIWVLSTFLWSTVWDIALGVPYELPEMKRNLKAVARFEQM